MPFLCAERYMVVDPSYCLLHEKVHLFHICGVTRLNKALADYLYIHKAAKHIPVFKYIWGWYMLIYRTQIIIRKRYLTSKSTNILPRFALYCEATETNQLARVERASCARYYNIIILNIFFLCHWLRGPRRHENIIITITISDEDFIFTIYSF